MSEITAATYLANAGIPVWIDADPAIAHNKVMVLDGTIVVTGSFDFTMAADTRNAENVVLIRSAEVASWYDRNWMFRQRASRRFEVE